MIVNLLVVMTLSTFHFFAQATTVQAPESCRMALNMKGNLVLKMDARKGEINVETPTALHELNDLKSAKLRKKLLGLIKDAKYRFGIPEELFDVSPDYESFYTDSESTSDNNYEVLFRNIRHHLESLGFKTETIENKQILLKISSSLDINGWYYSILKFMNFVNEQNLAYEPVSLGIEPISAHAAAFYSYGENGLRAGVFTGVINDFNSKDMPDHLIPHELWHFNQAIRRRSGKSEGTWPNISIHGQDLDIDDHLVKELSISQTGLDRNEFRMTKMYMGFYGLMPEEIGAALFESRLNLDMGVSVIKLAINSIGEHAESSPPPHKVLAEIHNGYIHLLRSYSLLTRSYLMGRYAQLTLAKMMKTNSEMDLTGEVPRLIFMPEVYTQTSFRLGPGHPPIISGSDLVVELSKTTKQLKFQLKQIKAERDSIRLQLLNAFNLFQGIEVFAPIAFKNYLETGFPH